MPLLFSPHLPLPSPPPFRRTPIFSHPFRCRPHLLPLSTPPPAMPPGLHLLSVSASASSPSPFPASSLSLPSPLPSPAPPLLDTCSFGTLRLSGTGLLRPPTPSSLLVPFGQTGPNGGPPFRSCLTEPFRTTALYLVIFGRMKALGSAKQDRTNVLCSVLFDRTMLKGRGVLGSVPKSRRGMPGKSMYRGMEGGFWERARKEDSGKERGDRREGSGTKEEEGDEGGNERGRRWEKKIRGLY